MHEKVWANKENELQLATCNRLGQATSDAQNLFN